MWKSKFWQRKIPPNDSRKFSEEIIGLTPTPAVDSLAAAAQGWRYSHLKVILIVIHVFRLLHHFKRNLNLSEDRWLWFRDNVYETFYDVVNNFSIPSHLRSIYFIHSRSFSCVDLIFWLQVQRDSMWAIQREMLQLEHVIDSLTLDTNWRAHTTNSLTLSHDRLSNDAHWLFTRSKLKCRGAGEEIPNCGTFFSCACVELSCRESRERPTKLKRASNMFWILTVGHVVFKEGKKRNLSWLGPWTCVAIMNGYFTHLTVYWF